MKHTAFFICLLFLVSAIGCSRHGTYSEKTLDRASLLLADNPDSAYTLIAALERDTLSDESFARWCMIYGKLSYHIPLNPLPVFDWKYAADWYGKHGTPEEQGQAKLFLGEAYANEQEPDSAIKAYTDAFMLAERSREYNVMGYACSHMGSLYELQFHFPLSIEKFRQAATYFHEAGNERSHACALRDLSRQYVQLDSLALAFRTLREADSIASALNDNEVYSSILNVYGNLYLINKDYKQAEKYLSRSIRQAKNNLPNYITLIDMYIELGALHKAKKILQEIYPQNTRSYTLNYQYYRIAKKEKNYEQALEFLENTEELYDSISSFGANSHAAELEQRYTTVRLKNENTELKLKYTTLVLISLALVFCSAFIVYRQKKQNEKKLVRQQAETIQLKRQTQQLFLDIRQKEALLKDSEKGKEQIGRLQTEISLLKEMHVKLKRDILTRSAMYKKLQKLTRTHTNEKLLLNKELWTQITSEVNEIYPNLKSYVLERYPDISESEWNYCCFYLLGFDGNDSAKLLGVNPNTIYTKNLRLRQKLNITLPPQTSLLDYLIGELN